MTYHLTEAGFALCFDRETIPADGDVLFTFVGGDAERVCINGKFYPVTAGVARVKRAHLPNEFSLTVHTANGRRYRGDALAILAKEEGETLVPLSDCESHLLLSLSAAVAALKGRLDEVEATVKRLGEECHGTPITFGGLYES